MMSVFWYLVGAILMAMFVVGSRSRVGHVGVAVEIFMVLTWPLMVAI